MFGILILGDSIVHGRGEQPNIGWAGRLKEYFEKQDFFNAVYNLGVPGDSTDDLLERFDNEANARVQYYFPDNRFVIMVGVGSNDVRNIKVDNPQTPKDKFQKNILALIKKAKKFSKSVVFVGLLPVDESLTNPFEKSFTDPSKYTYFSNARNKEYNDIIKQCCNQEKIEFIDVLDDWLKTDYKHLLADGLHPNSKGYDKIYETVKEFLVKKELIT